MKTGQTARGRDVWPWNIVEINVSIPFRCRGGTDAWDNSRDCIGPGGWRFCWRHSSSVNRSWSSGGDPETCASRKYGGGRRRGRGWGQRWFLVRPVSMKVPRSLWSLSRAFHPRRRIIKYWRVGERGNVDNISNSCTTLSPTVNFAA